VPQRTPAGRSRDSGYTLVRTDQTELDCVEGELDAIPDADLVKDLRSGAA